MVNALKRFWKDEEGAAMIEYAILIGLIAVGAITAIGLIGGWVQTQFETLQTSLANS